MLGVPFKAAACVVLTVGLAAVAIAGISPAVDEERSMATASSPVLPFQRIQFDCGMVSLYPAPDGKVYADVPVLLAFPGDIPEDVTLTITNVRDVLFYPSDIVICDDLARENSPLALKTQNDKVWLHATFQASITRFELEVAGQTVPKGWTWNPAEVVELIERFRESEIIIETSSGERFVFAVDFSNYPTRDDITESLHTKVGVPLSYFPLERKENS